jgi:hypothetical protein
MVKIITRVAPALLLVSCASALAAPTASAAPAPRAPTLVSIVGGYTWSPNSSFYNFDGQAGAISVVRSRTGVYDVTFGNLGLSGGMVQVTPYRFRGTCAVGGWVDSGNLSVSVDCYSLAGQRRTRCSTCS